jgi:hypothetical protein
MEVESTNNLYCLPIAEVLASEKLTQKLLSLITKRKYYITLVSKVKLIRRGVKEVNKAFRKKELG